MYITQCIYNDILRWRTVVMRLRDMNIPRRSACAVLSSIVVVLPTASSGITSCSTCELHNVIAYHWFRDSTTPDSTIPDTTIPYHDVPWWWWWYYDTTPTCRWNCVFRFWRCPHLKCYNGMVAIWPKAVRGGQLQQVKWS